MWNSLKVGWYWGNAEDQLFFVPDICEDDNIFFEDETGNTQKFNTAPRVTVSENIVPIKNEDKKFAERLFEVNFFVENNDEN